MRYEINDDRSRLKIIVTPEEQAELREAESEGENIHGTQKLCEFLEPITCNSELQWIDPSLTGDLTDAPMLGIFGEEREAIPGEVWPRVNITGCRDGVNYASDVIERWAFMDYQVRSVLEDLRDKGECIFVS